MIGYRYRVTTSDAAYPRIEKIGDDEEEDGLSLSEAKAYVADMARGHIEHWQMVLRESARGTKMYAADMVRCCYCNRKHRLRPAYVGYKQMAWCATCDEGRESSQ